VLSGFFLLLHEDLDGDRLPPQSRRRIALDALRAGPRALAIPPSDLSDVRFVTMTNDDISSSELSTLLLLCGLGGRRKGRI